MRKRLFFCVTPLNVLIAQAIRARSPGVDTLVYVPALPSVKYRHYYDRFDWDRRIFASSAIRRPDLPLQMLAAANIMAALPRRGYDQLFVAAIGSIPFSSIASRYREAEIATFDDGTLHTDAGRLATWIEQEPRTHRLYRRITGKPSLKAELSRVSRHFTIYPAKLCPLDVAEIVELSLFDGLQPPRPDAQPLQVVLGTPDPADILGIGEADYQCLINSLDPDIYLPHPRERRDWEIRLHGNDAERLRHAASLLAAEDFVHELVKLGYHPSITGFGSTALLNLSGQFSTTAIFASHKPPERIFKQLGVCCMSIDEVMT